MSADFTPSLNTYTDLTPFRFWCQKILPIAYDDSLSYYELLCKVVDYLNKTMEDVELSIEDVEKLHDAYDELQTYVNTYFANLDLTEEINDKIDSLVADGTLHDIFTPDVMAILTQAQAATQQAINNIPNVVGTWLSQHVSPETGYVIDDSLSTKNAAADALATGVADSNIKSAVELAFFGEIEDDDFVQGYRTQADYYTVHNQTTRCTSAKYYHVYPGDTISISNIASGTKSAILGAGKTSATNYDSSWKTADFTYTAVNELIVFVETAKSDDTADILVSDVTTVFTLVDKSTRITDNENAIGELKSDLLNYIYGVNEQFAVTGGRVNKFEMMLLSGVTYTVTNNTGVAVNVILFKEDDTQLVITHQLLNGNSVSFAPPSNEYVKIGGFVNANPTGTFDVTCSYSDLENTKKIVTVEGTLSDVTETCDIDITEKVTVHENQFYNSNNQIYAGGNQWNYYTYPVNPGDVFTIDTVAGGTVRAWAFRNTNAEQLSISSYSGDVIQQEYTDVVAPAGAVELIVNYKHISGYLTIIKNNILVLREDKIYYNGVELTKYLDEIETNTNDIAAIKEDKSNILHGKVLCCCGDSITYGADMTGDELVTPTIESYQWSGYTKTWTRWTASEPACYGYQIAARNEMIFYNGGVSGATVQASGGDITVPGFSDASGEYTLLPNEIDYLTLFFGWNDTAYGTLGTISDNTNATYYGAYNVVLPYLINKYPYAKIALIVPFGTDVGHRQAIRDLANKWGLACFDMMQAGTPLYWGKEPSVEVDPAIVTANRTKFSAQANSPHPNYHGHYQIGTMLEQFLRGI